MSSPPHPHTEQHRSREREHWGKIEREGVRLTWVTGIAAVAGIAGLVVLYCTLRTAIGQFGLARETTERQLRAYVALKDIPALPNTTNDPYHPSTLMLYGTWRNSGSTPTQGFVSQAGCNRDDAFLFGAPNISYYRNAWVLGAASEIKVPICAIDETEIRKLRDNHLSVKVYGQANYADSFGKSRLTKFCLVLSSISGDSATKDVRGEFAPCQDAKSNCTDDECY